MARVQCFAIGITAVAVVALGAEVVWAFAAKKVDKRSSAKTVKGFGKAPPSLAETLATFKTRRPENAASQPCPCGLHGKVYADCCSPYHQGIAKPETPLAVLQSRYSAFCFREISYIMESTHPSCRDYREDKIAWAKDLDKTGTFDSFDFVGLTVLSEDKVSSDDVEGYVDFQVQLQAKRQVGSEIEGQVTTIQERSKFIRDVSTGSWSYASGDVRSTVSGVESVKLNP
jgi:SEC-C motif domain protein